MPFAFRAPRLTLLSWCFPLLLAAMPGGTPGLRAQTTTLRVESRIVLLDIAVTDKQGHPVLDLKPEDFHIFERVGKEDVQQKIASFEPPSAHTLPAGQSDKIVVNSTADLGKIGQSPVTLLVLDELNMDFADRAYAKDKLIQWLGKQPAILPQPTALLAINDKDFHLLRDYTQDRDALLTILKHHSGDVEWRHENNGSLGPQASQNMFASLGAIEQVAQATRGVPGRKNLIWIGDGFPSINMGDAGRTSANEIIDALRRLSVTLLHARVTLSIIGPSIKAMQPTIIETQSDSDMVSMGGYDGLMLLSGGIQFAGLAPPTGGRAYGNRNDLDAEIGESIDAGQTYYTLSYRPSNPSNNPKEFRGIRVDIDRPGLQILTRDGYFEEAPRPATPPKPDSQRLAFDLFGAAKSTIAYTDLHLSVERDGSSDDFTIHAAARDMTWEDLPDGRRHTNLVLLAVCFRQDKMLSKTFATLGSTTEASLASINQVNPALHMHVIPAPGTTRIRFVVRDMDGGRVGTADYRP